MKREISPEVGLGTYGDGGYGEGLVCSGKRGGKADAPSPSQSPSSSELQSLSLQQGAAAESTIMKDNPLAPVDNDPFVNEFAPEPSFEASSSGDVNSAESNYVT
nr:hypothetical protein [Tanacetum cinerariifolium]